MARYESPRYHIIKSDGPIELRAYEGYSTTSVQEEDLAGRSGFGILFRYINGRNQSNEKIKMTVPVINEFDTRCVSMEFVVPKQYGQAVPKPQDPIIYFKHYPDHEAVVYKFKGNAKERTINTHVGTLRKWIQKNGLNAEQTFTLARYNPPFIPGIFKRNEIIIKLNES